MFTGIVEEIGRVAAIRRTAHRSMELEITSALAEDDLGPGDSVAVNGVCLTVTGLSAGGFKADVMPETVKATSLGMLRTGSSINLERALPALGRLGGHFVTGHVDGTGRILRKIQRGNAVYIDIAMPEEIMGGFIPRGSIAIDGVSLTVFGIHHSAAITVSIVPHTLNETVLGSRQAGDYVNVEADVLGKYIKHYMKKQSPLQEAVRGSLNTDG